MKFSPKCRAMKLGMIYTILGILAHFLIGKGPIWPRKIPGVLLVLARVIM